MAAQGPTDLNDKKDTHDLEVDLNSLVSSPAGVFLTSPRSGEVRFQQGKTGSLEPEPAADLAQNNPEEEVRETKRTRRSFLP